MPPKHKTSKMAANYGGTPSISNPNSDLSTTTTTTTTTTAAPAPGVEQLDRGDDLEQTLAWIEKGGRLGAKRLSKRLPPHTARGLVDGSTDPTALADTLVNRLMERTAAASDGTVRLAGVIGAAPGGSAGEKEQRADILDLLGYVFTRQALTPLACDDDDLQYEFYCDFKENFWNAMVDCQSSSESGAVLMIKNVKQAFDKTCLSWEGRLTARYFRGHPRGAFRRSCKLFNAPLEDFDRVLREDFHSKVGVDADRMNAGDAERLSCELKMAALGISQGLDQVDKSCWECNNDLKKRSECSGCNVALYCGRVCQVKAWKSGHKKACQHLKEKHEMWNDSLGAVDAAHVSGMLDGIQLRAGLDYLLLSRMPISTSPYAGASCEHFLGGPSMKTFYENLGRVIRGEWWFYQNAPSASEYQEFLVASGKTAKEQHCYFFMICSFLSFDYFKHVSDPEVVTSMFDSTSFVMKSSEEFGIPMPAEYFMSMYKSFKISASKDERLRVRTQAKARAWSDFRDSFHKG
jgi:hypothetical protein